MNASAIVLLTVLGLTGPADSMTVRRNDGATVLPHCLISPIEDVEVPAQEAGPLVSLDVQEGDWVNQGDVLARIEDRQAILDRHAAQRRRDAARAQAEDDIEIRYAVASLDVAQAELSQNQEINRRSPGSVPEAELRRLQLTKHRAELQIDKSQLDRKVAQLSAAVEDVQLRSAEENIARRRIVAPTSGVVVSVMRDRGEWVSAGEPVVRVVRMDRLRVDGFLQAEEHDPVEVAGKTLQLEVEHSGGRIVAFPGKVVFVSPLIQAGNKYRIRVEVENQMLDENWLLRPGMEATLVLPGQ